MTNPQALLAGFGLLRVLHKHGLDVRLQWAEATANIDGIDWPCLVDILAGYSATRRDSLELNWVGSLNGLAVDDYRLLYQQSNTETREWVSAYWYEANRSDGNAQWSPLDTTVGKRSSLCVAIRDSLAFMQKMGLETAFRRALLEPWVNNDDVASIGWDPGAIKRGATIQGGKPPAAAKHASVAAAQWLAWEAFPMLPARWLHVDRSQLVLPVPDQWVGYSAAKAMIISGPYLPADELVAQGWSRWSINLWKSGRDTFLSHARTSSDRDLPGGSRRADRREKTDLLEIGA